MTEMEHRRFFRLNRHLIVSYRLRNGSQPYSLTQTRDVSQGGMSILSDSPFEPGKLLDLLINFPFRPNERVALLGKVVSCRRQETSKSYRIGVSFIGSDPRLTSELALFIAKFSVPVLE